MMRLALTLAAAVVAGSLGLAATTASAAPAIPQPGVLAGVGTVEHVMHRGPHHHGHHQVGHGRTTKHERMMRRENTFRHGNPNARNPERPGYQQQLGNTTNGPRY